MEAQSRHRRCQSICQSEAVHAGDKAALDVGKVGTPRSLIDDAR
jgi:hypothetical protein